MIYLLRHGQTEFNIVGRYQGQSDSPLTRLGREQALANGMLLARHLGSASIWTSPLARAVQTAALVAQALPDSTVDPDARLREVSFGHWEGLTRQEIEAGWPGIRKQYPPRQWKLHAPGGEGIAVVVSRLGAVLAEAARQPGPVILVSHGVAGRLIRGLHAGLPTSEALMLPAPHDVVYRLHADGLVDELPGNRT